MYPYSDPTGTGHLAAAGALQLYRELIAALEEAVHELVGSACTLREAFDELAAGVQPETATVSWSAFPVTAAAGSRQIDQQRLKHQDEYVEWRAESQAGALSQVTFTTEFTEYFEALAAAGTDALKDEVRALYPGAAPSNAELFGAGFNPDTATPRARAAAFIRQLRNNSWNNGQRGIMCLSHQSNTLGALFGLLGPCGIPRPQLSPGSVCAAVKADGACVPERNSDPSVCGAVQGLAQADQSFSLEDPFGIRILGLDSGSEWRVEGQVVDMNDEGANGGIWKVTRNGRRATFTFRGSVRLNGATIATGAELAKEVLVGATVIHAANGAVPQWARTGNERRRRG
jgi:hypothetical protein